ncbi:MULTISPECIES: ATP-binding protein [Thermomonosporaceae]|uniref:ATP-binding protein n=1 Tax=Thermomonosporaceae TaxID=2012 RepID=UPI00255B32A1|nr:MULTISPECIES: ATP-binding protein [Thermomonosporaceae]MDL4772134.1 ATP-binding protein [Actinomadura xylanilytica]
MNDQDLTSSPLGIPEVRLTLLAEPSSVVLARELVRYALGDWGCGRDLVNDSMLVMSEIVTNAVAAARGHHIRLRCTMQDQAPLLECWDPSPALPAPRAAPETAENGRGLTIVAAYAKEAGVRRSATGKGKIVWALMAT